VAAQTSQHHRGIPSELHDCKPILTGDQSRDQLACTAQSKVDDVLGHAWEVGSATLTALSVTKNKADLTKKIKIVVPNERSATNVASKIYDYSNRKSIRSALGLLVLASGAVAIYEWIHGKNDALLVEVVPPSPRKPSISTAISKPDASSTTLHSDVDVGESH
jgi:hypothetical protein